MRILSRPMSEGEPAVAPEQYRIASIERLRILAILGIVWFHTENATGRSVGYAGLPAFVMIFCALSARKSRPEDIGPFAKKKAKRLLMPWLFWGVVYAGCKLLKQSLYGLDLSESFTAQMFLAGPKIHLWYLPFAFAAGLIVNLLHRCTRHISSPVTILSGILVGGLLLFFCSMITPSITAPSIQWHFPVPQWIFALPAVPLGFCVGRVFCSFRNQVRMQRLFYLGIVLVVEAVCLLLLCLGSRYLVIPYGIAVVLVCAAFLGKTRCSAPLRKFASLAYGIYLIHPLVASMLRVAGMETMNPLATLAILFLVSSVVTLILQETPLRRFV